MVPGTLHRARGSVANIKGIAVTNVFGERLGSKPQAAGTTTTGNDGRCSLFRSKERVTKPADLSLVIPPAAQKVIEGPELEEILFARDEMANMVWGVERTIPLPSGEPKRGSEAANETRSFFERRVGATTSPVPFAPGAKIRYKVMTSVPENWIPMIPVHVPGDNRETQLQRAAMLRIIEGDPNVPVP